MKAAVYLPVCLALALASGLASPARSAEARPAEQVQTRQTRHALIIGIGTYLDPDVPVLKGVVHDMTSALQMAHAMAIADDHITILRDQDATAEHIRAAIDALQARMHEGDRVFIYYSGHGTRWYDPQLKADDCTEGLLAADGRALTNVELGQRLAPLARRADKMLVFYDACFSGGVVDAPFRTRSLRIGGDAITPKFTRVGAPAMCAKPSNFKTRSLAQVMQQAQALPENVVQVAASRSDEVSFDSSAIGGFATASWRDCLLGEARDLDGSGAITADEVTRCAQAKVTRALDGQPGILGQQMTVAGNASFVPAWMGEAFSGAAAAPPGPASAPAEAASGVASGDAAGAPPAAPALASPAEILAELDRQRDGQRRVEAALRQSRLRIGRDALQVDITPGHDGYLYLALAAADGHSLYLLYPNDLATDNRVRAGERLSLPGKEWEIVGDGPPGTETLLVMVTDAPRELGGLAHEQAGPFMKTLLDAQGRARLQWLLSNGTPAPDCGQAGRPPCSDAFGSTLLQVQTVP
jgi:hypothetical protein